RFATVLCSVLPRSLSASSPSPSAIPLSLPSPRRPPSPLFPSTTLFRSPGRRRRPARRRLGRCRDRRDSLGRARRRRRARPRLSRDRKSTRLNSSHQIISYAVFCLKKKINPVGSRPDQHENDAEQNDDKL